jgi:chorismate mutase/prephenate dehydratase
VTLDELRQKIDTLDTQILQLLNERARCAMQIGDIKRNKQDVYYVPEREKTVYDELRRKNLGPLPERAVRSIYREIISAMRALEKTITVGFLGPRDTFSHLAAQRIFGANAEYHPLSSVGDIFTEVERKRIDYGVVPVETAMSGGVSDTLDRFISSDLTIINEVMMHITQSLLSNTPFEEIRKVYSRPQPFVQCRNWLRANLPNAELVETSSTSEAARIAAEEAGAASLGSELAAETYGLKIVATGIEDASHNYTRFFVIGHHAPKPTGNDKTSVLCAIKDRPGGLYALLLPLASRGINLTRIESRPSQKKAWEYVFFMDMFGHIDEPKIKDALESVAKQCSEFRVLGSYPHGELEE